MPEYRCNTDLANTAQTLRGTAAHLHLEDRPANDYSGCFTNTDNRYRCQYDLTTDPDLPEHTSRIRFHILRSKSHVLLTQVLCFIECFGFLFLLLSENKISLLMVVGIFISIIAANIGMELLLHDHHKARTAIDELLADLRKQFRVEQIKPVNFLVEPLEAHLHIGNLILVLIMFGFICGQYFMIGLIPVGCVAISYMLLNIKLKNPWRSAILSSQMKWAIVCFLPFAVTCIMVIITVDRWGNELTTPHWPLSNFTSNLESLNDSDQLQILSPDTFALEIISAKMQIQNFVSQYPNIPQSEVVDFYKRQSLIATCIFIVTILTFAFVGYYAMRITQRHWQYTRDGESAQTQETAIYNADEILTSNNVFNMTIFGLGSAILHWLAIYITLSIFWYLYYDEALYSQSLTLGFAFFTNSILDAFASYPRLCELLGILALFIVSLPGLLIGIKLIWRICSNILLWEKNIYTSPSDVPTWLPADTEAINSWCDEIGLPHPIIQVSKSVPQIITVRKGLFSRQPRLVISSQCQTLTDLEFKAVFLHEMAHVKYDLKLLSWLRIVSLLIASPVQFATIFYDYGKRELAADRFAAETMHTSEYLHSALIKLNITGRFSLSEHKSDLNDLGSVAIVARKWRDWLNDDSIMAAAYPTLTERLHHLKHIDTNRIV